MNLYKIDENSIKKITDVYNLLNQLEVRGISNVGYLYSSMISLQQVLQEIEKQNNSESIIIDNTKGG